MRIKKTWLIIIILCFNYIQTYPLDEFRIFDQEQISNTQASNAKKESSILDENFTIQLPFNETSVPVTENNTLQRTLGLQNNLYLNSAYNSSWNCNPKIQDLQYRLLSNVDMETAPHWTESDNLETYGTIGTTFTSFGDGPNGSNCSMFYFDTNGTLAPKVLYSNEYLIDENYPNIYNSSTLLDFDYKISSISGNLEETDHQISLHLQFGDQNNGGEMIFWLKYNPNYLPSNEILPGVYRSSTEKPVLYVLLNNETETQWLRCENNITSLLQTCFPRTEYPNISHAFTQLTNVKIKVSFLTISDTFYGTFSFDNFRLNTSISQDQMSQYVTFSNLNQTTKNFQVEPQLLQPGRLNGSVIYDINNSLNYGVDLELNVTNHYDIKGKIDLFQNFTSPHGSKVDIQIKTPFNWVYVENESSNQLSFVKKVLDTDVLEFYFSVTNDSAISIIFIVENMIDTVTMPETVELNTTYQIAGELKELSSKKISYQIFNQFQTLVFEKKILCYSNKEFEFLMLELPNELTSGLYYHRVFIQDNQQFGYVSSYLKVDPQYSINIGEIYTSPAFELESVKFEVDIHDINGNILSNCSVFVDGPLGYHEMVFSENTLNYEYFHPIVKIKSGEYLFEINAFCGEYSAEKMCLININPSQVVLEVTNLPNTVDQYTKTNFSVYSYVNNTEFGFHPLEDGILSIEVNNTIVEIQTIETGLNYVTLTNLSETSNIIILELIITIKDYVRATQTFVLSIIESQVSDRQKASCVLQNVELANVNSTVDLIYNISYPQNGDKWYIDATGLEIDPQYCFIRRGDVNFVGSIINSTIQWNLASTNNDVDSLIVRISTPKMYISRTIKDDQVILDITIESTSTLERFFANIPLKTWESDIEIWNVTDSLGKDISAVVNVETTGSHLRLNNLSIIRDSIIKLKIKGYLPEFICFDSLCEPKYWQYDQKMTITYNVSYNSFIAAYVDVNIGNKFLETKIMTTSGNTGNRLLQVELDPYEWNSVVNIEIKMLNLHRDLLYSENKTFQIIDTKKPHYTILVRELSSLMNLTIEAYEETRASGIKNCSLVFSNHIVNVTNFEINNQTYIFYQTITKDEWDLDFEVQICDRAGNVRIIRKNDMQVLDKDPNVNFKDNQFEGLVSIGIGSLSGIISLLFFLFKKKSDLIEI